MWLIDTMGWDFQLCQAEFIVNLVAVLQTLYPDQDCFTLEDHATTDVRVRNLRQFLDRFRLGETKDWKKKIGVISPYAQQVHFSIFRLRELRLIDVPGSVKGNAEDTSNFDIVGK